MPEEFNVHLFEQATESGVVYGSKAVGEPPLMLALQRPRGAAAGGRRRSGRPGTAVDLGSPATPEAVYWAVEAARARRRPSTRAGAAGPPLAGV